MAKAKKRKVPWGTIGMVVLGLIVIVVGYSVYVYYKSGIPEEGLQLCEGGKCFLIPGDIHAKMDILICGEKFGLPLYKGISLGPHTHRERNMIHFEGKLELDPETMEISDTTTLKIRTIFEVMEVQFSEDCVNEVCTCNGQPARVYMTVNNVPNEGFGEYVWSDGDEIEIELR